QLRDLASTARAPIEAADVDLPGVAEEVAVPVAGEAGRALRPHGDWYAVAHGRRRDRDLDAVHGSAGYRRASAVVVAARHQAIADPQVDRSWVLGGDVYFVSLDGCGQDGPAGEGGDAQATGEVHGMLRGHGRPVARAAKWFAGFQPLRGRGGVGH